MQPVILDESKFDLSGKVKPFAFFGFFGPYTNDARIKINKIAE